jgi:uncharacterized protein YydD (DUF2326 family)
MICDYINPSNQRIKRSIIFGKYQLKLALRDIQLNIEEHYDKKISLGFIQYTIDQYNIVMAALNQKVNDLCTPLIAAASAAYNTPRNFNSIF